MMKGKESLREALGAGNGQGLAGNAVYEPGFYRLHSPEGKAALEALLEQKPFLKIYDQLSSQLRELVKSLHPERKLTEEEIRAMVREHTGGMPLEEYGVWVYYPWHEKLVHILDEQEFVELRTNRNQYKITRQERDLLATKKIGVIGLSVGQSVALTLAMERTFGELRIADFDTLDLSNYNRIRTGLHNIGLLKTVAVAREIAEIDPFLKVVCFNEGINDTNLEAFFLGGGRLDLLVEECDSLDIKIKSRYKARELKIPVVMDTSDRGMIDIERFDLEPERQLLHGLIGKLQADQLNNLTDEQKIPYMFKMVGFTTLSSRAKASALEVGQTLTTWPQLCSSVIMGGGIIAEIARKIFLHQSNASGRFYVDLDQLIPDKQGETRIKPIPSSPVPPITEDLMIEISLKLEALPLAIDQIIPNREVIKEIVDTAGKAPSSGNDQPWKWFYKKDGVLLLFHDISRSYSFGDYRNMASYISLGASLENLSLAAHNYQCEIEISLFPLPDNKQLVASVRFFKIRNEKTDSHFDDSLFNYIDTRHTNRKITRRTLIDNKILHSLRSAATSVNGAEVLFTDKEDELNSLGKIISAADRIRVLHPHGHYDFFHREMRWTNEEAERKKDGMLVDTLDIPPVALSALKILSEDGVINTIREIDGGHMFKNVSVQNAITSSAMGLLIMPNYSPEDFVRGGRAMQRLWLEATKYNLAFQPLIAPLYLFPRILFGEGEGLTEKMVEELKMLREKFEKIFLSKGKGEVLLFRVFVADPVKTSSLRLDLNDILFFD